MEIHNITLRAIAQATESEDRVRSALSLFLFDGNIETIASEGHFGNPITIFQVRMTGRNCDRFIEFLKSRLPEQEMYRLKKEVSDRVDDDCALHIRFDKQAAYRGVVQLATTPDAITAEVKMKVYPAKREKAASAAEKLFDPGTNSTLNCRTDERKCTHLIHHAARSHT